MFVTFLFNKILELRCHRNILNIFEGSRLQNVVLATKTYHKMEKKQLNKTTKILTILSWFDFQKFLLGCIIILDMQ